MNGERKKERSKLRGAEIQEDEKHQKQKGNMTKSNKWRRKQINKNRQKDINKRGKNERNKHRGNERESEEKEI